MYLAKLPLRNSRGNEGGGGFVRDINIFHSFMRLCIVLLLFISECYFKVVLLSGAT